MWRERKGLEPLAKIIMAQNANNIESIASKYINSEIFSKEDALAGAPDIHCRMVERAFVHQETASKSFPTQICDYFKSGKS